MTIQLPVLAPIEEKCTEIKQQIIKATIKSLKANTCASWVEKTDLLANHFVNFAAAAHMQANSAIQDSLNYGTTMCIFDSAEILDGTLHALPAGSANDHSAGSRSNACWIAIPLTVRPSLIQTDTPDILPTPFPPDEMTTMYIKAI